MISAKALFKINAYNKCLRVVETLEAHWHPMQNIPGKQETHVAKWNRVIGPAPWLQQT